MRIKCSSTLLTATLILAAGCHKQDTGSVRKESEANKAFDITQAMNMLYGNYDVTKQTSVASLAKENGSFPAAGEEQMTVRPVFHAFSGDAGDKVSCLSPMLSQLMMNPMSVTPARQQLEWLSFLRRD